MRRAAYQILIRKPTIYKPTPLLPCSGLTCSRKQHYQSVSSFRPLCILRVYHANCHLSEAHGYRKLPNSMLCRSSSESYKNGTGVTKPSVYDIFTQLVPYFTGIVAGLILGLLLPWAPVNQNNIKETAPVPHSPIPQSIFSPTVPRVMEPDQRFIGWNEYSNRHWRQITERM